jgi:hypothetical protein
MPLSPWRALRIKMNFWVSATVTVLTVKCRVRRLVLLKNDRNRPDFL